MHLHLLALYAATGIVVVAYVVDRYILKPRAIQRIAKRRKSLDQHVTDLQEELDHDDVMDRFKARSEAYQKKVAWTQSPDPPPPVINPKTYYGSTAKQIRESLMKEKLDQQFIGPVPDLPLPELIPPRYKRSHKHGKSQSTQDQEDNHQDKASAQGEQAS